MNEKQYCAASARIETLKMEARLNLAFSKLQSGRQKHEADVAKAELDLKKARLTAVEECGALELAAQEAKLDLDRSRAYEIKAEADEERGFEA